VAADPAAVPVADSAAVPVADTDVDSVRGAGSLDLRARLIEDHTMTKLELPWPERNNQILVFERS
jgi:hypothetical protein